MTPGESLTVLSPHRDDAVFSMGLALSYFCAKPIHVSVLNFFTVSQYAPRSLETSIEEISALRRTEDLQALAAIHASIREASLDMLDAPLRPGIQFDNIMQPCALATLQPSFLASLQSAIEQQTAGRLLAAPLSVGNHVDHIAVRHAALATGSGRLAFYEDLPYAADAPSNEITAKVQEAEESLATQLVPVLFSDANAAEQKTYWASFYSSQISSEEAKRIGMFASARGGERLWLPANSPRWSKLRP